MPVPEKAPVPGPHNLSPTRCREFRIRQRAKHQSLPPHPVACITGQGTARAHLHGRPLRKRHLHQLNSIHVPKHLWPPPKHILFVVWRRACISGAWHSKPASKRHPYLTYAQAFFVQSCLPQAQATVTEQMHQYDRRWGDSAIILGYYIPSGRNVVQET